MLCKRLGGGAEPRPTVASQISTRVARFYLSRKLHLQGFSQPEGKLTPCCDPASPLPPAAPLCLPHFLANWKPSYVLEVPPPSQNPYSSWKRLGLHREQGSGEERREELSCPCPREVPPTRDSSQATLEGPALCRGLLIPQRGGSDLQGLYSRQQPTILE